MHVLASTTVVVVVVMVMVMCGVPVMCVNAEQYLNVRDMLKLGRISGVSPSRATGYTAYAVTTYLVRRQSIVMISPFSLIITSEYNHYM